VRLGTFLLIPAVLTAQAPLPWDGTPELPWETAIPGALPPPLPPVPASPGPQRLVSLSGDGTLRISDAQGRVTLRLGLSGRPLRLLRDGGTPMTVGDFPSPFPLETPLAKGLGSLPLAGDDFRPAMQGLLWILDDGERRITLVHPATQQVVYLPLPPGQDWEIHLHPDRLEIRERPSSLEGRQETSCWSIPWLILLPQFVRLSLPPPPGNRGTAFVPFPQE
jgi:hypothetical protein